MLVDDVVHLNKHGWFTVDGINRGNSQEADQSEKQASPHDEDSYRESQQKGLENHGSFDSKVLLKPTKTIMASACSGHAWNFKSRVSPRALSIREMRLSTQINWKNFTLLK